MTDENLKKEYIKVFSEGFFVTYKECMLSVDLPVL